MRFRIRSNSGEQGRIVIGKIAISGNKWEKTGMNLNNFSISAIEKFEPEYKSILTNRYLDLYGLENTVTKGEQALKIAYNAAIQSYGDFFS